MEIDIDEGIRLETVTELIVKLTELQNNNELGSYDYTSRGHKLYIGKGTGGNYLYIEDTSIVLIKDFKGRIDSIYTSPLDGIEIEIDLDTMNSLDSLEHLMGTLSDLEDTIRGDDYDNLPLTDRFIDTAEDLVSCYSSVARKEWEDINYIATHKDLLYLAKYADTEKVALSAWYVIKDRVDIKTLLNIKEFSTYSKIVTKAEALLATK